jgi:hypothetical protein
MPLNLDFSDEACVNFNKDQQNMILREEAYYENKLTQIDQLIEYTKKADVVHLNDTEIDNPDIITGMRIGLMLAKNQIGEFPLKIEDPDDDEE